MLITPALNDSRQYSSITGSMDHILLPALSYAAWLFFLPRALVNLSLTYKHVVPGSWMGPRERALGWQTRFKTQMERRWFELGNDIAALVVNLLNCFLFVGALSPLGLYVVGMSLTFDVALASLRAYIEISRLKKLEEKYRGMLVGDLSDDERVETERYIAHLNQRITYEQKRLYIQIMIAAALLIAFAMTFPIFANPIVPIIGAVLAVLTTIAWYSSLKWIIHQKPADKVPALPKTTTEDASGVKVEDVPVTTGFFCLFGLFKPKDSPRHAVDSTSELPGLMGSS